MGWLHYPESTLCVAAVESRVQYNTYLHTCGKRKKRRKGIGSVGRSVGRFVGRYSILSW